MRLDSLGVFQKLFLGGQVQGHGQLENVFKMAVLLFITCIFTYTVIIL